MKNELRKLIFERYKWLMLGLGLAIILLAITTTSGSVSSWKSNFNEMEKAVSEERFYEDLLKDTDYSTYGKMYLYSDEETGRDISTDDYQVYKDYQLSFTWGDMGMYGTNYYHESVFSLLVIAIVAGFSLFFYDNKTHFNNLLFSSRFKRKEIYQMKFKLVGGTFILGLIVSRFITLLGLVMFIPQEYLQANFMELLPSQLLVIFFLSAIFITSSFAGVILGQWITAILTLVGFWVTLPQFFYSLPFGFLSKERSVIIVDSYQSFFSYYGWIKLDILNFSEILLPIALCVLVSVIFYFWGQKLFNQVSLEAEGDYLMFGFLKKPAQWLFVFYTFIVLNGSQFFEALEIAIKGESPYEEFAYEPNLVGIIISSLVIAIISYLVAQLVIYRKLPFQFRKKGEEPAYK